MAIALGGSERPILRAALVSGFVSGLDATSQFFVFPEIRDTLAGGDAALASWILTVPGIVGAAILLQAGRLADRYGRNRVLIVGAGLYAVFTLVAVVAPNIEILVLARALQAAGLAALGVASVAVIVAETEPSKLAGALGLWGTITAVSGVVGPPMSAALVDAVSWRWAFGAQIPFAVLILLLALPAWGGDDAVFTSTKVDYLGMAMAVAGLASVVLSLLEAGDWGWTSTKTLGVFALGVLLVALVALRSRGHEDPVLPLELFRSQPFSISIVIGFISAIGFYAMWLALLSWMTELWDYKVISAGLILTLMPGTMMLLSAWSGRLIDRIGFRPIMTVGALLFAAGFGLGAAALGEEPRPALMVVVAISAGIGMATVFPSTTAAGSRTLPPHRVATGTALLQTVQRMGGGLGPALVVTILESQRRGALGAHRATVLMIAGIGVAIAMLCASLTPARMRLAEVPDS